MQFLQLFTAFLGGIAIGSLGMLFLFALVRGVARNEASAAENIGVNTDASPGDATLRSV